MSLTATIFNLSRCSLNDGPGIRTVVYFKGCNLSCEWCHNPEGLCFEREISFAKSKCIGCGKCLEICPKCHTIDGFDRSKCSACGKCVDGCTAKALEVVGKEYTPQSLFEEVKKDKPYFERGGGVTLSGGECLLQAEFVLEFLRLCKENGLHTLIESAFCVPAENIQKVLPYTDLFYVDCKLFDDEKHRLYTGASNKTILQNLKDFAPKKQTVIRMPLIPNVNDDMENLCKTIEFAKSVNAQGVELLRFNPLGVSKYQTIGKTGKVFTKEPQEKSAVLSLTEQLNEYVKEKDFVISR